MPSDRVPQLRLDRNELFMLTAQLFGMRSSCPRGQVGAIAVVDGRIIATGYVGAPAGQPHCIDVGCQIENDSCVRTVHAEANVVAFAAYTGVSLLEAVLYTTHKPCYNCAKLIANSGISEVIWQHEYHDERGVDLLQSLDIRVERYATSSPGQDPLV